MTSIIVFIPLLRTLACPLILCQYAMPIDVLQDCAVGSDASIISPHNKNTHGFQRHRLAPPVLHAFEDPSHQVFSNALAPVGLANRKHADVSGLNDCVVILVDDVAVCFVLVRRLDHRVRRYLLGIDFAHDASANLPGSLIEGKDTQVGETIQKVSIGKNAVGLRQIAGDQPVDVLEAGLVFVVDKDDAIVSGLGGIVAAHDVAFVLFLLLGHGSRVGFYSLYAAGNSKGGLSLERSGSWLDSCGFQRVIF